MDIRAKFFTQDSEPSKEQDDLFDFFALYWNETWKELKVEAPHFEDDFYRLHSQVGFFHDSKPIAFHGYGYFDLRKKSHREHSYFKKVGVPFAEELVRRNRTKLISLEYMMVHPEYRKFSNTHMAEILMGFSTQYFVGSDFHGYIGPCRNNRKINDLGKQVGGIPLFENILLHQVEVDIYLVPLEQVQLHPNPNVQSKIDDLLLQTQTQSTWRMAA